MRLLITCPYGLVNTLNQELKYLRFTPMDSFDTGTYVDTDMHGMMTINLQSRIASKVYIQAQEAVFCDSFESLFTITQQIQRTQWLPSSEYLTITAHSFQSTLQSEKSIQSIVHKAILQQLMDHGKQIVQPTQKPYEIMAQIINNQVTFFLNSSGDGLHKRGWRTEQGAASLKENVAAGLVLMSGRRRQQRFRDPCCGSGTIGIEAAMIARNIAPGLQRSFAFEYFTCFEEKAFHDIRKTLTEKSYPTKSFAIFCSDNDPEMIEKSLKNAERAGVADTIKFFEHDILSNQSLVASDSSQLVIVTNPPYGKRLAPEGLKDLYRALIKLSTDEQTHLTCITSYQEFPHLLSTRRPRKDAKNGADDVHIWMKPKG